MLRLPESPRWLVKADRRDDAREALRGVREDGSDLDAELDEIVELEEEERSAGRDEPRLARAAQAWVRPALVVGCGIAVFTQLSGIEMIIYYAPTILTDNGFSESAALRVSLALGVTYLVMMIVGLAIVDQVGRRRLTLIMVPGAALALAVLGALFVTGHDGRGDIPLDRRLPDRLHVLQRRRPAADGLADGLGDLPAGGAQRRHERAVDDAVDHEHADHADRADHDRGDRRRARPCGSTRASTSRPGSSSCSGCPS